MVEKRNTVKGKYYVATAINELIEQGKRVVPFEVDRFVSWGQALNLREFEYWEDYYDAMERHPYRKNRGITIREGDGLAV